MKLNRIIWHGVDSLGRLAYRTVLISVPKKFYIETCPNHYNIQERVTKNHKFKFSFGEPPKSSYS